MLEGKNIQVHFHGAVHVSEQMARFYRSLYPTIVSREFRVNAQDIREARNLSMESNLTYKEALATIKVISAVKCFFDPSLRPKRVIPVRC